MRAEPVLHTGIVRAHRAGAAGDGAAGGGVCAWGVAEILGELFAHGAVAKGDVAAVTARAADVVAGRTPVVEFNTRFLLERMQAQTLAVYGALA